MNEKSAEGEARVAVDHPLIRVLERALPGGKRAVTLELRDWVVVVAEDAEDNLILVHQHRHGVDGETLECPGGVVDPGESTEEAALRELREETGYEARALESLGVVHPNPALHGNRAFFYRARGVRPVGTPDPAEIKAIELLPIGEAQRAIDEGRITHSMSVLPIERALRESARQTIEALIEDMAELQRRKIVELAQRLRPGLAFEDLKQPHDFPELDDPDFHFEDGQLTGIESVAMALRAR